MLSIQPQLWSRRLAVSNSINHHHHNHCGWFSTSSHRPNRFPIRLSKRFVPTLKNDSVQSKGNDASGGDIELKSLELLLRGGYLRQSSSGVYTLLPNGLRMVEKIQSIIDQEMQNIGCSKLAMPTLLSSKLWKKTARYQLMGSELYKVKDRKNSEFVLAPTHEEEVTKLVSAEVESDRSLPVRVYQITRKHRDEPRPRMGLLRSKEFVMKDLYTFDADLDSAQKTYDAVRGAYRNVFDRTFGVRRWKSADADTGAIGGSRSHEYHVEDPTGQDTLLSCSHCDYTANSEKAVSMPSTNAMPTSASQATFQLCGSTNLQDQQQTMYALVFPSNRTLNSVKLEKLLAKTQSKFPLTLLYDDSQAATLANNQWDWQDRPEGPLVRFDRVELLVDFECSALDLEEMDGGLRKAIVGFSSPSSTMQDTMSAAPMPSLIDLFPNQFSQLATTPTAAVMAPLTMVDVRNAQEGDTCPSCRTVGSLKQTKAIEVGHTFLLGEKYSRLLQVGFQESGNSARSSSSSSSSSSSPSSSPPASLLKNGRKPFQMGCYGIGVSRILGALAQKAVQDFDQIHTKRLASTTVNGKPPLRDMRGNGLVWPMSVTPFKVVIIVSDGKDENKQRIADQVYLALVRLCQSQLKPIETVIQELAQPIEQESPPQDNDLMEWQDQSFEIVIDDRIHQTLGSKLADSDLVGYPIRIIIGKVWEKKRDIEIQILNTKGSQPGWNTVFIPFDKVVQSGQKLK